MTQSKSLAEQYRQLGERSRCWLVRNVALPAGDLAFGQNMMHRLRFLEQAQWWDRRRLIQHRDLQVAKLIDTAYREVPFYRAIMDKARVGPRDIQNAAQLARMPVVTKDMLLAGYPHLTTRPTGQKTFEARTSGSTGKNFVVREDAETSGSYRATMLLALEWSGWKIGQGHLQTGVTSTRNLERRLKDRLLRCHYVSACHLDDAHLDLALELLDRHKIEHLWGYAASLYHLAQRAAQKGWNRPLRSIVTWGDNLYPHFRREIEAVFGCRISDTYGIAEGIQISAQCGEGANYHVHNLDVVVEYLDDAGYAVPAGEPGNLILTRLHPGPMPLIRYRVGDVGIAGDQSPCPCGRALDRMQQIRGRDTDVVVTPSGNRLIVHFFTGIIEHFPEVNSFQVVQETSDSLDLALVTNAGFSERMGLALVAAMQRSGADLEIRIKVVQEIPLTAGGKRRFVINKSSAQQRSTQISL